MNKEHNTLEELTLYAMQNLAAEDSASIRAHLQICSACRTAHARVGIDLALMGLVVQPRELPSGARERFIGRIAASRLVRAQDTPARDAILSKSVRQGKDSWNSSGGGGSRNGPTSLSGGTKIFATSGERTPYKVNSSTIEKKSLLNMNPPAPVATRISRETTSQIATARHTPYRVAAARIVNIF